jgi:hypothetical protein
LPTRITELRNWKLKRLNLGAIGLERQSSRLFLSTGSSLLRYTLKEAWDHFFRPAQLNGAIFFVDDLQNITGIGKSELALTIRDQFQSLGVERMNYSICLSAKSDYFAETKALAEPARRRDYRMHALGLQYLAGHNRDNRCLASPKDARTPVLSCFRLQASIGR